MPQDRETYADCGNCGNDQMMSRNS
jgi:hypothetical protein